MVKQDGKSVETQGSALARDLQDLYDEMTEFNDCCAFLCDAFCSLVAEEEALETSTEEGLTCLSYWLQQRITTMKARLKGMLERVPDEAHI